MKIDQGQSDFVQFSIHKKIIEEIKASLSERPVSIRFLAGRTGAGKTWTMSRIWREAESWHNDESKTIVIGLPSIGTRNYAEMAFVNGILESVHNAQSDTCRSLLSELSKLKSKKLDKREEYVLTALLNPDSLSDLIDAGSKLPKIGDISPPTRSAAEGAFPLFMGFLSLCKKSGFDSVLILFDEAETLFTTYGRKSIILFSNFLRKVYDEREKPDPSYPSLQILIAGTYEVLERVSPNLVGIQSAAGSVVEALQRRLSPPIVLMPPSNKEVLEIASYRIGEHRKKELNQPFIPYDEDAIQFMWGSSGGSIGGFCLGLERMYEIAKAQGSERIQKTHAEMAIRERTIDLSS